MKKQIIVSICTMWLLNSLNAEGQKKDISSTSSGSIEYAQNMTDRDSLNHIPANGIHPVNGSGNRPNHKIVNPPAPAMNQIRGNSKFETGEFNFDSTIFHHELRVATSLYNAAIPNMTNNSDNPQGTEPLETNIELEDEDESSEFASEMSVYPNPIISDNFHVWLEIEEGNISGEIIITTMSGVEVLSFSIPDADTRNLDLEFPSSFMIPGSYMLSWNCNSQKLSKVITVE